MLVCRARFGLCWSCAIDAQDRKLTRNHKIHMLRSKTLPGAGPQDRLFKIEDPSPQQNRYRTLKTIEMLAYAAGFCPKSKFIGIHRVLISSDFFQFSSANSFWNSSELISLYFLFRAGKQVGWPSLLVFPPSSPLLLPPSSLLPPFLHQFALLPPSSPPFSLLHPSASFLLLLVSFPPPSPFLCPSPPSAVKLPPTVVLH